MTTSGIKTTNKGTIIRTVVLGFALVNQILVMSGISTLPFTGEEVELFLTGAFTAIAAITTWWKNNSFTKEAQTADELLEELKKK